MASAGSTKARGYSGRHQALRAEYKQRMTNGELFACWRCGLILDPTQPWDLGHDDHDRTQYRGPEHRGRECPAGGNRATFRRRVTQFRRWSL